MIHTAHNMVLYRDPLMNLVVIGPYCDLQNSIILGVINLLVGDSLMLSSAGLAVLGMVVFFLNALYFIHRDEPGSGARFGAEYR